MAEQNDDKSLDPTPHRRQQARERGQLARSQDLSSAGLLLGGLVVLVFAGGSLLDFLVEFLSRSLGGDAWASWIAAGLSADGEVVAGQWNAVASGLAKALLPLLGLGTLLAVAANLAQTGFLFLPQKLAPDFSHVNPLAGLARLFSATGAVRLGLGVFKIAAIMAVAFFSLYHRRGELASLPQLDLGQIVVFTWQICLSTCVKIGVALLALAALDYLFERLRLERDLKMTPQELREEMRNLQGDPQVAARRRGVERQWVLDRALESVPQADVIIADADTLSVALRYDADSMPAPIVVARASGPLAQRMSRLAAQHGVPIVEKSSLARALYRQVDPRRPIPDRLYAAVAEVLTYAYDLKKG